MTTHESNMDIEDFHYQARLEQQLKEKPLFEERVRIIKELPANAIHNEVEEIYLKYQQSNKLSEDGDYVESSKVIDSDIKVEVKNGTINCYYFDGQFVAGHGAIIEETTITQNAPPLNYSSLNYSGNMVNDPSPTKVRNI
jgi:hypothetical protein